MAHLEFGGTSSIKEQASRKLRSHVIVVRLHGSSPQIFNITQKLGSSNIELAERSIPLECIKRVGTTHTDCELSPQPSVYYETQNLEMNPTVQPVVLISTELTLLDPPTIPIFISPSPVTNETPKLYEMVLPKSSNGALAA